MEFDLQRVRANVRKASTEDLLDRATVYRTNLEPAALPVILEELKARGVTADAIVRHERDRPRGVGRGVRGPRPVRRAPPVTPPIWVGRPPVIGPPVDAGAGPAVPTIAGDELGPRDQPVGDDRRVGGGPPGDERGPE